MWYPEKQTSRTLPGIATLIGALILAASSQAIAADPPAGAAAQSPGVTTAQLSDLPVISGFPDWLTLSGQIRGRFEMPWGVSYTPGLNDFYYGSRVRLELGVKAGRWARFMIQTQDARLEGYQLAARPATMHDPLDVRQLYFEAGSTETKAARIRIGRQELNYGGGWLVSTADWANTTRVFDAVRGSATIAGFKADAFAATVVQADSARLDRHKPGEHLYGTYWSQEKAIPRGIADGFLMAKTQTLVVGELGSRGHATTYLGGMRALGKLPLAFDYSMLIAREWGDYADDRISAMGGFAILGWTAGSSPLKPRFSGELDFASGDRNAKDGTKGTFDQFYGAYHYFLGAADRLGWRNSRNLRAGFDFAPCRKCKLSTDVRDLALATVADGLYAGSGSRDVLNTKATSKHVGVEFDGVFGYQYNALTSIGLGFGHVIPGAYLRQSSHGAAYTFPYVMFTRKL